jgi:hypothetical protein
MSTATSRGDNLNLNDQKHSSVLYPTITSLGEIVTEEKAEDMFFKSRISLA